MKPTLLFCNLFWVLFSVITCVVAYRLKLGSLGKKKGWRGETEHCGPVEELTSQKAIQGEEERDEARG